MYQATMAIREKFEELGLKFFVQEAGSLSAIEVPLQGENTRMVIHFISSDDDSDVRVRTGSIARFPASKIEKGCELADYLNREYKFIKFVIDDDGDLMAQYDLLMCIPMADVPEVALELLVRFRKIIDGCYSTVMETLWG